MESIKISKIENNFQVIKWTLLAISKGKKDIRESLKHLFIADRKVVATDGHRLHEGVLCDDIPAGLYKVVANTKEEIFLELTSGYEFPDYKRCFPKEGTPFKGFEVSVSGENDLNRAIANIIRALDDCCAVQIDFLKDALLNAEKLTAKIHEGTLGIMVFEGKDRMALVMPLKH